MNHSHLRRLTLVGLLFLCTLAVGCGVEPSYQFPVIPIKVSYDILSKKLQVSISGSIQTPIGTFGLTASAAPASNQFGGVRTLTLETGGGQYVYQLEKGKRYSINLPSDENGEAKVIYSGVDENLSIVIPNPTTETVGELRRKLKEEQEARARAEAAARADEEADQTEPEYSAAEAEQQQQAQESQAQQQREQQAREEAYQQQLDAERQRREAAELREQQSQLRAQEAQRQAQEARQREQETQQQNEEMAARHRNEEAERQQRNEEAERQQRKDEQRRRRNEALIRLGVNTAREVLRRRN